MQERALIKFLLENRAMMNYISILMLVYAVWAIIEVITNASGAMWWPPETGTPVISSDRTQNINNGWVIGSGAVFGTVGSMIQYFYRAAPYVDASMQATAALIISAVKEEQIQESAEKLAEEIVAEAEEAAEAEEEAAAKAAIKEVKAAAKEAKATAKKAKAAEAEMAEEAKESAVAEEDSEASTETEEAVEGGPKKKF